MTRPTLLLMTAVLLLAATRGAYAQGHVTMTVTPAAVVFPAPGPGDFMAGYVDAPPVTVEVFSRPARLPWEVQIRADVPDLGGYGKPIKDLLWRPDGSTTWQPLTMASQVLATGSGDTNLVVHFRMRLDWTYDEPGSYAASFTFTALRP